MKTKRNRTAAFFLLALLPLSLFAQGAGPGEARSDPLSSFSLAVHYAPGSPTLLGGAISQAYDPSAPLPPEQFRFKSITRDFLKDAGEIWTYPLHIKTRDILPIFGLATVTGLLIWKDVPIRKAMWDYRRTHAWVKALSPAFSNLGTFGSWGLCALYLILSKPGSHSLETGILAASAILQTGILVTFLKGITGRQRPYWDNGVDHWSGPVGFFATFKAGNAGRYDSFPSGHTATAFSLATVLAMQYSEKAWVPIAAYAAAVGVGLARVTEGKHWLSSPVVGGVLGYLIGRMVVLNHRSRYHIQPTVGLVNGTPSFAVTFSIR